MTARHLLTLPVTYAVSHVSTPRDLIVSPEIAAAMRGVEQEQVYSDIWANARTAWQAVQLAFNAGLRGAWLTAPEGWREPLVH